MHVTNQYTQNEAAMALQPVCTDGMVAEPCHAKSPVVCGVRTSPELGYEACSHQPTHCLDINVLPIKAHMSNLALKQCSNLMELQADVHGVKVRYMLDSGATHSFVHPSVVCLTSATMSKGALLTLTVANGKQVEFHEATELELMFQVQDGGRQVQTKVVSYMLDGLSTDVILGMDFLKWYNPSIS